jgi:pumilio family protein 6
MIRMIRAPPISSYRKSRPKKFLVVDIGRARRTCPAHNTKMAGIKRKSDLPAHSETKVKSKKLKVDKPVKRAAKPDKTSSKKPTKKAKVQEESEELIESDTTEEENGFYGFAADKGVAVGASEDEEMSEASPAGQHLKPNKKTQEGVHPDRKKAINAPDGEKPSTLGSLNGRPSLCGSSRRQC